VDFGGPLPLDLINGLPPTRTQPEERISTGPGKPLHVVFLVPRGEAVRNFLFSQCLSHVSARAQVTVLSVVEDKKVVDAFRSYCARVLPLEQFEESYFVRLLRQLLEYSHERWMWTKPTQTRWRKRAARAKSLSARLKWLLKSLFARVCGNSPLLSLLSRAERFFSVWLEPTDHYVRLFDRLKPDLVFNGSHIHSPAAVLPIQAANRLGIPTATFVFSWDNLTSRGRIFLQYDHFLMWNERMKGQLLQLYSKLEQHQVTVTGTPQFDFHFDLRFSKAREAFCAEIGADPSRPIILYSTGMPHYMAEEPRIVLGVADMLREMVDLGPPQLLLRVYPKDTSGRFEPLIEARPDILAPQVKWEQCWMTPYPEDLYLLTNSLRHCACGINVASTMSLELAMLDKPVINVAYNPPGVDIGPVDYAEYYEFDHYGPVVESGCVRLAHSEDEMARAIHEELETPALRAEERAGFTSEFFGPYLDGGSGERVAACLLRLAEMKLEGKD
jgi:hypothetical protein